MYFSKAANKYSVPTYDVLPHDEQEIHMIHSNSDLSHKCSRRQRRPIIRTVLLAGLLSLLIVASLTIIPFVNFGKGGATSPLVPVLSGTSIKTSTVTVEHKSGGLADASRIAAYKSTNEGMKIGAIESADPFVVRACESELAEGGSQNARVNSELEVISTGWPLRSFATRTLNHLSPNPIVATPVVMTQTYEARKSGTEEWATSVEALPDERVEWRAVVHFDVVRNVVATTQLPPYISWRNTGLNLLAFWVATAAVLFVGRSVIRSR